MTNTNSYDIGIVGGGLVGLCAALALQHTGQRIAVIEATRLEQPDSGGLNARSIALSYSSVQIFRALGIWRSIRQQAAAIEHIHISSQGRWGISRLRASDYDIPALGYVIESRHLAASLLQRVAASEQINLITDATFESIENGETVAIGYQHQGKTNELSCRLALIADGANSQARARLGIDHNTVDYGQSAIIANVEFDKPAMNHAYERFTDQGPLAILPLGGNRYACVWTRDNQTAASLMQADDAVFIEALQACFGFRMGYIEQIGERFCFPLNRTEARQLIRGKCVLIGNAANTLHPVAGQGFNLALRDVATLYELLKTETPLVEYQRLRQREQQQVVCMGDGLVNLFSNQLPLLDHVRAGSLALLDHLPILKAQVAMSGMGLSFGGNAMLRGHL